MERKIGEIFEFGGEWYQCLKSPDGSCKHCDMNFGGKCPIPIKECVASARSDLSYVIFKKLEKVGDLFSDEHFGLVKKYELKMYSYSTKDKRVCFADGYDVFIKIKQNKEDMEEKKTNFMEAIDALCKRYNMSDGVRTDFMSELKEIIKDKDKEYNLKPFDLEAAKLGKPVCTRDGRKARIICFDRVGDFPIVALTDDRDYKEEGVNLYDINGKGSNECFDLMMLPEKKEGWVNVYKRENEYICENECSVSTGIAVYKSEGEAKRDIDKSEIYINTIKITWE